MDYKSKLFLLLTILLPIESVTAVDYSYTLFSTFRHSDNLAQTVSEVSGNSLDTGVTFALDSDENSALQFDVSGSLSREFFSVDAIGPEDTKQVSASLTYSALSNNFEFLLRDDLAQTPSNRFSTQDIGNRSDVNTLTARPSYRYRLTNIDTVEFGYTWLDSSREGGEIQIAGEQSFDSTTKTKSIQYDRRINSTNDIALQASRADTNFANTPGAVDYTQDDALVRWVSRGKYNQFQIEAGKTRIIQPGQEDFDSNVAYLLFTRKMSQYSDFELSVRDGVLIALNENRITDDVTTDSSLTSFGRAQSFKSKNITYSRKGDFLTLDFNLFDIEFDGILDSNTEAREGVNVITSYSTSRLFDTPLESNIQLIYRHSKNEFNNENLGFIQNKVDLFRLRYNHYISPVTSVFIQITKRNTEGTQLNSSFNGGDSNSISVGFNYAPYESKELGLRQK